MKEVRVVMAAPVVREALRMRERAVLGRPQGEAPAAPAMPGTARREFPVESGTVVRRVPPRRVLTFLMYQRVSLVAISIETRTADFAP
ncbi:hypothetical protein LGT36_005815 [Demequina sp. TMPB413]|uniref:hypothetical protein n=2 Tax=unclassified Demequina TaxID=2620311 RepID=UPI001CF384BA|nr:hypothetical protein [Demequina sp. TMPB413]UPU89444.1 hypothetical protein LGT36_005815 [Demequina sp. TMPB413]